MVMAEDKSSGLLLRADIIVDKIHSLKIVTKTHELYLEETPEKFEVRAYDEAGNEFSTLQGIKFRWTIEGGGGGTSKGTDILRFMTWKDSPYNTEPILEKLESEGYQGNKVLMEGIKTGSARVSVRLVDSQHSQVAPASEPLMVVANLFLVPPAAYLLPCANLQFAANQFKSNKLVPVKLPSVNHNLVVDPKLAQLDPAAASVTAGNNVGVGVVELVDKNVAPGEMVKTPTSDLFVVTPASLDLQLQPHNSWTVVVGREAVIVVTIMDLDNNRVFASDNLHISLNVDSSYFKISNSLSNGTMHTGTPQQPGKVTVTASLTGAGSCDLETPVTVSAVMEIVPEMRLDPELTLLAWDPLAEVTYTVKHTVVGGPEAARLTWTNSNTSLASTNQLGVSRVTGGQVGSVQVTSHLTRHSHCDASAKIQVVPAVSLSLAPEHQEWEVASVLQVPLQMTSDLGQLSHCHSLPLLPSLSDSLFSAGISPSVSSSDCASVSVTSGLTPGHTKVSVTWTYVADDTGDLVTLTDSKYLASYSPLTPVRPATGDTVVALDSERDLAWSGGPLPWPLQPSGHYSSVSVEDAGLVSTVRSSSGADHSLYVWRMKCLAVGDTKVTLTVGNHPSSSLANPVHVSSSIHIHCAKPHTILLTPNIPGPTLPNLPPCPLQARQGRLAAQSYLDLKMLVTIKDASDRVIDSVAGVKVDWKLSDNSLGQVSALDGVIQKGEDPAYQVLKVAGKPGSLDVVATIARDGGLLGSSSSSDTAKLRLVEDAVIAPSALEIFVLETGVGKASQGSGYFTVLQDTDSREIMSGSYSSSNSTVMVAPVNTGVASLSLVDLCLSSKTEAVLQIKVAGVDKVILETKDRIQLGDSIKARVKMVDNSGRSLPLSSLQHVTLDIVSEHSYVSVGHKDPQDSGVFSLSGDSLGQAVLTGRASYAGKMITSAPVTVTVYPPLVLDPRNISLIIGASFQFTWTGGPADCGVKWTVADPSLARTNEDGVVTSLALGSTTLTCSSLCTDSMDSVTVFIRPLSSLQMIVPTTTVGVNSQVPVYLYGQDMDMNVYSYGSALPLLNIDWSVSGQSQSSEPLVRSPLAPAGHSLVSDNSGVVVFSPKVPGKFTLTATVSITSRLEESGQVQLERDRSITVSTTITVMDRLEIINLQDQESVTSGDLLLAPDSSYQLKSNKQSVFSVQDSSIATVTRSGLVKSGKKLGSTTVVARHGHMEVAVVVSVQPVHYLLVRAGAGGWTGDSLENVPRGGKLELMVTHHDKWGRQFSGLSSTDLGYRPSRFDLIKMTPTSMNMVAKGWTVVRVWDKMTKVEGWMVVKVGEAVYGTVSSLQVGDVVDYDSYVRTGDGGHWTSDPAGILQLDPATGVVVASRPGQTRLSYITGQGGSVFTRNIAVSGDRQQVTMDTSCVLGGGQDRVVVKIVIGDEGHTSNLVPADGGPVTLPDNILPLFSCDLAWDGQDQTLPDIASVMTALPQWTGSHWACVVDQLGPGPAHPVVTRLSVLDSVGTLRYLPPLSVHQSSLEVGVAGGVVRVTGHSSVLDMLQTRHSDGLELGSAWLESEGELMIPVSLTLTHYASNPTVTITVPATRQSINVSILPLVSSCKTNTGFLSAMLGELITYYQTVLCIIIVSIITAYVTKTQFSSKTGAAPASSKPAPAPVSKAPESPSKTGAGDTSQNAASPYLWTVDNSPIYGSPIYRYIIDSIFIRIFKN